MAPRTEEEAPRQSRAPALGEPPPAAGAGDGSRGDTCGPAGASGPFGTVRVPTAALAKHTAPSLLGSGEGSAGVGGSRRPRGAAEPLPTRGSP